MTRNVALSVVLLSMLLAGAAGAGVAADGAPAAQPEAYAPGLGDFMTAYVQPHHIKLWLAGNSGDWKLAAYEADELGETFDDITTYQATWKTVPVAKLVKAIIEPSLKKVDAAIAAKNAAAFKTAYRELTAGCNSCHMSASHDFLEIKVPTANPFSDQTFAAH
jgi:cytochrome c556